MSFAPNSYLPSWLRAQFEDLLPGCAEWRMCLWLKCAGILALKPASLIRMRAYFQATLVLAPAWSTSFEALGRADLSRRLDRVFAAQFKSCSALHSARAGFPGRNMRSYAIDDSHHLHHARPER